MSLFDLASQNLLSPMVLFFVLGLLAAVARSDLSIPEAVAKLLALYLMMSIGFRGGAEVGHHGLTAKLGAAVAAGVALSFLTPVAAFAVLRLVSRLGTVDAAAVAAHYGSISAVTLVAVTGVLTQMGVPFEGYLIAVAAAMETPAILSALLLARRGNGGASGARTSDLVREIGLNGSVVMLLGAFVITGVGDPFGGGGPRAGSVARVGDLEISEPDLRQAFERFVARAREIGIEAPIVPGVMPITNVAQITRITQLSGADLPADLVAELEARADDPEAVQEFGVAFATLQCAELLAGGAPGIHFYTLNRSPATRAILSALRLHRPWETNA